MTQPALDDWYLEHLACPRDRRPLADRDGSLSCPEGHHYPVVQGVPVLLLDDVPQTLHVARASLDASAPDPAGAGPVARNDLFLDTLGLHQDQKRDLAQLIARAAADPAPAVDPVVAYLVAATNGLAYRHLVGRLPDYPIPVLRWPPGRGERLLDVGCNWGRWCLAAARQGYDPVGLDPCLGAVLAARRVARQLGLRPRFVVGDARFLPFRDGCFGRVFSYSVVQHFSRDDARQAVAEMGRVLAPGGRSLVQMPNRLGLRCLYHQARRRFREPTGFDVRYWSLADLRSLFQERVGPARLSVDCFFGLGLQSADLRLMPWTHRAAIRTSEVLRRLSRAVPPLTWAADSIYVEAVKPGDSKAAAIPPKDPSRQPASDPAPGAVP